MQVNHTRWLEARQYEHRTWMNNKGAFTDRNEEHRERFANYVPLRGLTFSLGVELGCGPFTNIRFVLEQCCIEEIHLLDPLIQDYLTHPSCRYRHGRLGGILNHPFLTGDIRRPGEFVRNILN
jgi:hypothetical protein